MEFGKMTKLIIEKIKKKYIWIIKYLIISINLYFSHYICSRKEECAKIGYSADKSLQLSNDLMNTSTVLFN